MQEMVINKTKIILKNMAKFYHIENDDRRSRGNEDIQKSFECFESEIRFINIIICINEKCIYSPYAFDKIIRKNKKTSSQNSSQNYKKTTYIKQKQNLS